MAYIKYILKSKCVFDSIDYEPKPAAVVVAGNKIEAVITHEEIENWSDSQTKVLDFGDRTIMPGFIDGHTHTGNFMEMIDPAFCVDVSEARSFPEVMAKIRDFAERNPESILYAFNYNPLNMTDDIIPKAKEIEKYIPDRPVLIAALGYHTWYANDKAMKAAGINKEAAAYESGIETDENGELTGVFNDSAVYPLQRSLERPLEMRKNSLKLFLGKVNAAGITTLGDVFPCGATSPYPVFKAAEEADELTARIYFYPSLLDTENGEISEFQKEYNSDMLRFSGLKALLDGVVTTHSAWMLEPYTDKPDTCGGPAIDKDKMRQKLLNACSQGLSCRVHAIGDAAVRYTLDCYEEAYNAYGPSKKCHVIEHLESCKPEDVHRFAELNVAANMQTSHFVYYLDEENDANTLRRYVGIEREQNAWALRRFIDAGVTIATGSDYPIVHYNPMLGVHAAVTRQTNNGYPEGGWLPEHKLSLAEILKIYTLDTAKSLNADEIIGSLEAGKMADITVMNSNLFKLEPHEILNAKPVFTMCNGNIVFKA